MGGASRRFGSPKALAQLEGASLAEHAWRTLGELSDERIAVGKAGELELPFAIVDDGSDARAPLAGVVTGLRVALHDRVVFLPVDTPFVRADDLRKLADAGGQAAVPPTGPLPGAYARAALPVLERRLQAGELALRDALDELEAQIVELDPLQLLNVNTPADLELARRRLQAGRG